MTLIYLSLIVNKAINYYRGHSRTSRIVKKQSSVLVNYFLILNHYDLDFL